MQLLHQFTDQIGEFHRIFHRHPLDQQCLIVQKLCIFLYLFPIRAVQLGQTGKYRMLWIDLQHQLCLYLVFCRHGIENLFHFQGQIPFTGQADRMAFRRLDRVTRSTLPFRAFFISSNSSLLASFFSSSAFFSSSVSRSRSLEETDLKGFSL